MRPSSTPERLPGLPPPPREPAPPGRLSEALTRLGGWLFPPSPPTERRFVFVRPDGSEVGLTVTSNRRGRAQVDFPRPSPICWDCRRRIENAAGRFPPDEDSGAFYRECERILQRCRAACLTPRAESAPHVRLVESAPAAASPPEPATDAPRIKVLPARPAAESAERSGGAPPPPEAVPAEPARPRIAVVSSRPSDERDGVRWADPVPEVSFERPGGGRVTVWIPEAACARLRSEGARSARHGREVAGFLVGFLHAPPAAAAGEEDVHHVVVTDVIPGGSLDSSGSHVTLDEEMFARFQDAYQTTYRPQDKEILGWYHTHPTQPVFFSAQDRDVHREFTRLFQFGLVVQPRDQEAGLFYWQDRNAGTLGEPIRFSLRPGSPAPAPAPGSVPGASADRPAGQARGALRWPRLVGVLALAIAGLGWGCEGQGLHAVTAAEACVAAVVLLGILRLWNLGWFHPADPLERRWAEACWRWYDSVGEPSPDTVAIVLFVVVILVLFCLLLFVMVDRMQPVGHYVCVPGAASGTCGPGRL